MDSANSILNELERPPSRNNLTIVSIIELLIIVLIGFESVKDLFDIFKVGSYSFIDLIKIVVDLVVFVGFVLAAYAFITENGGLLKNGYQLFFYGCLGLVILSLLGLVKDGFSLGNLIKFLLLAFVVYIIHMQLKHL